VLNVGIALAHLNVPTLTISPLGGAAKKAIDDEFESLGVRRRWIDVCRPTRVCTTIIEAEGHRVTELVENAGPLGDDELDRFAAAVAEAAGGADAVVLTGSLPDGVPATFFRDLALPASCPLVLDIRGEELLAALSLRPLVVKPNREELGHTLGRRLDDETQLRAAMAELNERGAQWVVISAGAGPVWASSAGGFYRFGVPRTAVVNPIGCGDCLAAGIAWGLARGDEPRAAVRLGMAAAVDNVGQLLPARIDSGRVQALVETIRVEYL
jgi:1-phosphofructokinase family hexose kinase